MERRMMPSLIDQIRGVSYKPTDLHDSLDVDSITLLRANNIDDGKINFDDVVYVDRKCVSKSQLLRKGDILICASSGSRNLVGKAAQVDFEGEYTFGAFCKVVRPRLKSDAGYIGMFFQSPIYRRTIAEKAQGININNIRGEHIDSMAVCWPDQIDRQKAVETYQVLRDCIRLRKRQLNTLDTLIKARFVEMFEQGTYEEVEFGDICVFLRNGANIKQTKGAAGIPITRIETLANDVFNTDRLGYADIFEIGKYSSYRLQTGDILISHINSIAYLGRAVQYKGQLGDEPIIHGMNLLCARIVDSFNPTFVEFFFKTPIARDYISIITKKAVNQASITTTDLKKMRIPAPSIEEQERFASFVSQVDKSKVVVQKALDKAQLLFDSLMQQYFG